MRLPTFYEQNLIPNWGRVWTYQLLKWEVTFSTV